MENFGKSLGLNSAIVNYKQRQQCLCCVLMLCFVDGSFLFLGYSQLKQAIFDRAHVGAIGISEGFWFGNLRVHQNSMGQTLFSGHQI